MREILEQLEDRRAQARLGGGQKRIEAHFFPGRLDAEGWKKLSAQSGVNEALLSFWQELKAGFDAFEATRRLPTVRVAKDGRYQVEAKR